jgi:hypothetical protein
LTLCDFDWSRLPNATGFIEQDYCRTKDVEALTEARLVIHLGYVHDKRNLDIDNNDDDE